MPTNVRDPRSIITPDAFGISPDLLGVPLARPRSRLWAILVDLAVVGTLTAVLSSVQLVLWGMVAAVLLYAAVRRPERVPGFPHAALLLRGFMGCLGAVILGIVLIVFTFTYLRVDRGSGPGEDVAPSDTPVVVEAEGTAAPDADSLEAAIRRRLEGELAAAGTRGGAGSGLVDLLRDVWDQLGSAIGLWSVYFTVLLTLWNGQTLGKRLLGIRVVRLDGLPLTWWPSFERAGGYAAGIATGLLGFAQVFWDANRQCVHDKIVGTVVVLSDARPVPGAMLETRRGGPTAPGPGSVPYHQEP